MKKYTTELTRLSMLSVVILGGTVLIGCAGNSTMPSSAISGPVAKAESIEDVKPTQGNSEAITVKAQVENSEVIVDNGTVEKFPQIDISKNEQPKQMKFFFGFDRTSLDETDKKAIEQHARFMIDNPGLIMQISGHTDKHGARAYNEYLSKQRASEVAKIMINAGVPESQLVIKALADDQPLTDASETRKNRRVELEYQELNLVSTH
jgi:peptidoglycan-associated lipoprotein